MQQTIVQNSIENFKLSEAYKDIRSFGSQSLAYSALQEGVREFRYPSFNGFIAYSSAMGIDYVLSDPIVPDRDLLKSTFVFLSSRSNVVFTQISQRYAFLLNHLGFKVNGFGVENVVHLPDFKVGWRNKKCLKSYLSKLGKRGFYVFEMDPDPQAIEAINSQWLEQKGQSKELRFMARPFNGLKEKDVRYFYLIKDCQVIGFCTFDPIYDRRQNGRIKSYVLQHLRVANEAPLGSQDYLILNALFQFKEEGLESVSLGLSPLHHRDNSDFQHSGLAEVVFSSIYRSSALYNYKSIGAHKDHYKADQVQTYVATPHSFSAKKLFGLLKVNNLI